MRAWRIVATIILCSVAAPQAFGQSPAPSVLNIPWGTTLEEVVRTHPDAQCLVVRTDVSDWRCILTDRLVSAVSADVVLYGYSVGSALGLVGIVLGFDAADVNMLVEALVERYGDWTRMVERDFATKAEKRFSSAIWLWHLAGMEIRVEQDRGTLGHGQAMIMWEAGLRELQARGDIW